MTTRSSTQRRSSSAERRNSHAGQISGRRIRRSLPAAVIGALVLLSCFPGALGCVGDGQRQEAYDKSRAAWASDTQADVLLTLKAWTPQEAATSLDAKATVRGRLSASGALLVAETGSLASTGGSTDFVQTTLDFIRDFGVLFCADEQCPQEPVTFRVLAAPLPYQRGNTKGVFVRLSQQIDGFQVGDGLVGAQFEATEMKRITVRIFDPARSPTRSPLSVPTTDAARPMFEQAGIACASAQPGAYVVFSEKAAYWTVGYKRLDAVSGAWLPDVSPPISDPIEKVGGAK